MIRILCNAIASGVEAAVSVIHEDHNECTVIVGSLHTNGGVGVSDQLVNQLVALAEFDSIHCIFAGIRIECGGGRRTDNIDAL